MLESAKRVGIVRAGYTHPSEGGRKGSREEIRVHRGLIGSCPKNISRSGSLFLEVLRLLKRRGDISGRIGTIRYMKRIVFTALGVPPRQSGRADSVRHVRESGDLKSARRRAMESLRGASAGTPLPINIHERLKEEARTLEAIDRRREDEDNPYVGLDVEERILTRELRDLERATAAHDMGAE